MVVRGGRLSGREPLPVLPLPLKPRLLPRVFAQLKPVLAPMLAPVLAPVLIPVLVAVLLPVGVLAVIPVLLSVLQVLMLLSLLLRPLLLLVLALSLLVPLLLLLLPPRGQPKIYPAPPVELEARHPRPTRAYRRLPIPACWGTAAAAAAAAQTTTAYKARLAPAPLPPPLATAGLAAAVAPGLAVAVVSAAGLAEGRAAGGSGWRRRPALPLQGGVVLLPGLPPLALPPPPLWLTVSPAVLLTPCTARDAVEGGGNGGFMSVRGQPRLWRQQ